MACRTGLSGRHPEATKSFDAFLPMPRPSKPSSAQAKPLHSSVGEPSWCGAGLARSRRPAPRDLILGWRYVPMQVVAAGGPVGEPWHNPAESGSGHEIRSE